MSDQKQQAGQTQPTRPAQPAQTRQQQQTVQSPQQPQHQQPNGASTNNNSNTIQVPVASLQQAPTPVPPSMQQQAMSVAQPQLVPQAVMTPGPVPTPGVMPIAAATPQPLQVPQPGSPLQMAPGTTIRSTMPQQVSLSQMPGVQVIQQPIHSPPCLQPFYNQQFQMLQNAAVQGIHQAVQVSSMNPQMGLAVQGRPPSVGPKSPTMIAPVPPTSQVQMKPPGSSTSSPTPGNGSNKATGLNGKPGTVPTNPQQQQQAQRMQGTIMQRPQSQPVVIGQVGHLQAIAATLATQNMPLGQQQILATQTTTLIGNPPLYIRAAPPSQLQPQQGIVGTVQPALPVQQTPIANIQMAEARAIINMEMEDTALEDICRWKQEDLYEDLLAVGCQSACVMSALSAVPTREVHIRTKDFYMKVVPTLSEMDFKTHFRLTRHTSEVLMCDLAGRGLKAATYHGGPNKPIEVDKMVLAVIWYLANQEAMRSVADRFDMAKSSLHFCLRKIGRYLKGMCDEMIVWPSGAKAFAVEAGFKERAQFPGVVGAIDGSHILVEAPVERQDEYLNRKMSHSVVLQAVCDANMVFTNIFCGFPGSCHDARVLYNSSLYKIAEANNEKLFPTKNLHLVGDSAYPLLQWLLVPYKDHGNLDEAQVRYNKKHSQTRIIIECAFSMLKGRFRRLKGIKSKMVNVPEIVTSACVLHNYCLEKNDDGQCFMDIEETADETNGEINNSTSKNSLAVAKRNRIKDIL